MFEVVFQNSDFVAVDKPAGWLTVPSRFEKRDERKVLGRALEIELRRQLFPVHRLDFEVSGLVLFALNAGAHRRASSWFEGKDLQKTYQGLSGSRDFSHWPADLPKATEEIPLQEEQLWMCRLMRGKRRSYEHPKGDSAITQALRLGPETEDSEKWILRPETGRAHQLRFEMSRHGFPLKGDVLYGSKENFGGPHEIALRAVSLDFSNVTEADRMGLPAILEVKGFFS